MEKTGEFNENLQRRWKRLVLTPALVGGLLGFLASYLFFPPTYTSKALLREPPWQMEEFGSMSAHCVQGGRIDLACYKLHLAIPLQEEAMRRTRLRAMVEAMAIAKPEEEEETAVTIQENISLEPALTSSSGSESLNGKRESVLPSELLGFYLFYTDSKRLRAQQICDRLSLLLSQWYQEEEEQPYLAPRKESMTSWKESQQFLREQLKSLHADLLKCQKKQSDCQSGATCRELERNCQNRKQYYEDLLKMVNERKEGDAERKRQEQELRTGIEVLYPASLPDERYFANRLLFAGCLGMGLALGTSLMLVAYHEVRKLKRVTSG